MIVSTSQLLSAAEAGGYSIGAFNIYNLEGVKAVLAAAEAEASPVMLQIHPSALKYGGLPLIALSLEAARQSQIPAVLHLDHSNSIAPIQTALETGFGSIMADGSHLEYTQNIDFTRQMAELAHGRGVLVEAELGRLTGTEDGLSVADYEARLTDPDQALEFTQATGIDMLAVCIGNVHGEYRTEPDLDFPRLEKIHRRVAVPLVLHGASGLPEEMVLRSIELGVCKINVNTEVRMAYLNSLKSSLSVPTKLDLVEVMNNAIAAMQSVVAAKLRLFGSDSQARKFSQLFL
jgi:tagatose 1,6-diphosphate aldolase GatY/KbaY